MSSFLILNRLHSEKKANSVSHIHLIATQCFVALVSAKKLGVKYSTMDLSMVSLSS